MSKHDQVERYRIALAWQTAWERMSKAVAQGDFGAAFVCIGCYRPARVRGPLGWVCADCNTRKRGPDNA